MHHGFAPTRARSWLTANATNHVFLQYVSGAGNLVVNTTGSQPSNSIKLYEFVTNATVVTSQVNYTVDLDDDTIAIDDPLQVRKITSLEGLYGVFGKLLGTQPYLEMNDSSGGGTAFRLWVRNGKVQITDTAGSTVYVDDMTELWEGTTAPVIDKDLATPPPGPAVGARYIVPTGATGAWSGNAGKIAEWTGAAWRFFTPVEGWTAYVKDEDIVYAYNGTVWGDASGGGVVPPTANSDARRSQR